MVQTDKYQSALCALNRVLVLGRAMAYDRVAHSEIAELLDIAEYLPRLMAEEADTTEEFRAQLSFMAERWPRFNLALRAFDEPDSKLGSSA